MDCEAHRMNGKYTIGVDLGSLSARAAIVRVADGKIMAVGEHAYAHGVLEGTFGQNRMPGGVFLQNPEDYLEALGESIRQALAGSSVQPGQIAGIGVDSTSPTLIPTDAQGAPLCRSPRFAHHPFAQALMWKSHSGMEEVGDIVQAAQALQEPFLAYTGRNIASNLAVPKILHLLRNAPEVYDAAERFFDLSDWIVKLLTGRDTMNDATAGSKFFYVPGKGFPSRDFFARLDGRMQNFAQEKLPGPRDVLPQAAASGRLTRQGARLTGLPQGICVCAGHMDGLAPLPAAGVSQPGVFMLCIGTGVASYILNPRWELIGGVYGALNGSPFPGLYTYETGLQSFGDTLAWFLGNACPGWIAAGKSDGQAFSDLNARAEKIAPLHSGLLAMNWLNGNRSLLLDGDLTGVLLGLRLTTRPEEIYRALVESMAFNFKMIVDQFAAHQMPTRRAVAAGGIPMKNPFIMQLVSDIMGLPIDVPQSAQLPAIGCAIFAAAAAGCHAGLDAAIEAMMVRDLKTYRPDLDKTEKYQPLYRLYAQLCREFGQGENSPLKRLFALGWEA